MKFRGQTEKGDFIYGYLNYSQQQDTHYIGVMEFMTPVKSETIGRLTGLHDKFGEDIYEGDVLQLDSTKYVVRFSDGCWRALKTNYSIMYISAMDFEKSEVIGNIFENPELI